MSSDAYSLEPFPIFVDSVDPSKVSYFSKIGAYHLLSPSGASLLRHKQDDITSKVTNYISMRYYQYEVTMGLYVMTTIEKLICNTVILGIMTFLSYAVYYGLQPFLIRSICHLLYYISGSLAGVEDICSGPGCS